MAFHAEASGNGEAVLRYAPATARRAARLGSHHEAAAQFERALRFADGAGPAERAELSEGLADEAALLGPLSVAEDAAERALSLWREAGDRLREGAALARLSRIKWSMGRGRDAVAAARESMSVLEPLGPTVELARAYTTLANQRMLFAEYGTATTLARRAQELAERFGANDVLSDALNTEAVSGSCQSLEWLVLMRRALDIALAGRHQKQAARAHVNLSVIAVEQWRLAEAERYIVEGIDYCADHGLATYAIRLRCEQAKLFERTGRWDEAMALTHELFRDADQSPVNRLDGLIGLGVIRARRGEVGAWECLDEAAAIADDQDEPPCKVGTRAVSTRSLARSPRDTPTPGSANDFSSLSGPSTTTSRPSSRNAAYQTVRPPAGWPGPTRRADPTFMTKPGARGMPWAPVDQIHRSPRGIRRARTGTGCHCIGRAPVAPRRARLILLECRRRSRYW
ncbi:hypothetical protein [Streptomyces violascens]